jgi:membrane-bound serine protease (ClpP class)
VEKILLDPNVAYLLLVGGVLLAILALLNPGTGILEVAALFALILAGWAVYNLPINPWALLVLLLGVFPFLLAVRRSRRLIYLALAILTLVIGSAFLFQGEGWQPAVHPVLALVVSALAGGFVWLVVTKSLEAVMARPDHDLNRLIGAIGEAKTDIHMEGSVQVAGELWSARSLKPIPAGTPVRVVKMNGFVLEVEAVE